ncbi:hypothetical protein EJ04DRAFT_576864 [Polyplosphaeria fusca]|uniref:Uncharacterized protein n=1 Tax=Polyplosphaeria fusca TaxID=682080 RepID=A0A9P4QV51_9PLEO|nr:hypothetical protein EJ04DRAFT_576864 [Polyplosphaeria fusca]
MVRGRHSFRFSPLFSLRRCHLLPGRYRCYLGKARRGGAFELARRKQAFQPRRSKCQRNSTTQTPGTMSTPLYIIYVSKHRPLGYSYNKYHVDSVLLRGLVTNNISITIILSPDINEFLWAEEAFVQLYHAFSPALAVCGRHPKQDYEIPRLLAAIISHAATYNAGVKPSVELRFRGPERMSNWDCFFECGSIKQRLLEGEYGRSLAEEWCGLDLELSKGLKQALRYAKRRECNEMQALGYWILGMLELGGFARLEAYGKIRGLSVWVNEHHAGSFEEIQDAIVQGDFKWWP